MGFISDKFELKVLKAIGFKVVGDFGSRVDNIGKLVGDEELCVLGNDNATWAVFILPRYSPSLILVHSSSFYILTQTLR